MKGAPFGFWGQYKRNVVAVFRIVRPVDETDDEGVVAFSKILFPGYLAIIARNIQLLGKLTYWGCLKARPLAFGASIKGMSSAVLRIFSHGGRDECCGGRCCFFKILFPGLFSQTCL